VDAPLLEVQGLTFAYDDQVMNFDLALSRGGIMALIGASGAGKTTLLSLIAGFDRPTGGRIVIDGKDVGDLAPDKRPVTMLFQEHNLFPHLSAAQNIGLGIHPGLRLTKADRDKVEAALARVGMAGLGARLPRQLSGGERQRVALARSLVRDRPLLLLDEPFAALGPSLKRDMLDLVDRLRRETGTAVLMVSHDPADARRIAETTAFIVAGRIVAIGPTAELLDHPPSPEIADYLGLAHG
jgi:thiamine transport system ATP-binding protein